MPDRHSLPRPAALRAIALAALLLWAAGCSTVGRNVSGIENFDTVDPPPHAIYRGAQPTPDGIDTLKRMDVRTVINLRDDPPSWEESVARQAGISYIWIPTAADTVDLPSIHRFLETLRTAPRPIFIHCHAGRDRTGLQVAIHRIVNEGWTRDAALEELGQHGHQWVFFPAIKSYLRSFNPNEFRVSETTSPPTTVPSTASAR